MALDGAAKRNIFLASSAGRGAESAKTRDVATRDGAARNVASSGDTWIRREKPGKVSNPFLNNTGKEKAGLFASLSRYEVETLEKETETRKEFSMESYLED